jgi:hypothetical protein
MRSRIARAAISGYLVLSTVAGFLLAGGVVSAWGFIGIVTFAQACLAVFLATAEFKPGFEPPLFREHARD